MKIIQPFDATRKQLWNEIVLVQEAWGQYSSLFVEDANRVELLNVCDGRFFNVVQRVLLREVLLGISRLTDPVKQGKCDNIVVSSLLWDPAVDKHDGLREELETAVARAIKSAESIRTHRNKYIAHLDAETALSNKSVILPRIQVESVNAAIRDISSAYNVHSIRIHEMHSFSDICAEENSISLIRILECSEKWMRWNQIKKRNPQ